MQQVARGTACGRLRAELLSSVSPRSGLRSKSAHLSLHRAWLNSITAPDIRTHAYNDEYEGGGRAGRGARTKQGGGDPRRQKSKSRKQDDDEDEWSKLAVVEDSGTSEEVSIAGMTPAAAPAAPLAGGADGGYRERPQRAAAPSGRSYGHGAGSGGYEPRGGGESGRGYGRGGGERRWGGTAQDPQQQQQPGREGGPVTGADGQQQGHWQRAGGRGQGQGQGRGYGGSYGGGRSSYGGSRGTYGSSTTEGGGAAGEERRTFKGPREAMSPEAIAARQANNDAVRTAADWREVAILLQSRGSNLDAENVSNMVMKVARDGKPASAADGPEFEALVASLYGWVSALVPVMRPKQLATCLYAVAKLELFNEELVAALAARALQMMGNFSSWEYSNMVWAFARMNYTPGKEWLGKFVYWTEKRLGTFRPVELSNTVSSLGRLGHVPDQGWLDAFTVSVGKQAAEFNTLECVNTLFGLASLGYGGGPDPGSWLQPLLISAGTVRTSGYGGSGSYNRSSVSASSIVSASSGGGGAVESMRVTDLTRTTWALTQFDWRPPERWLAAATRSFVAQLRFCLPSDLATISYSLAYLRAAPSPDGLRLLAAQLPKAWDKLSGDELANVAMSLALWQYRPPSDRWLDELVLACCDKLPSCSADGLAKVVSALPLLGPGYRLNQVVAQAQALLDGGAQRRAAEEGLTPEDAAAATCSPDADMTPAV